MIHVGNQTSCWAATPTEPFTYALANDFDAFEWFPDKKPNAGWDEGDLDPAQRRSIREAGQTRGVRFSVHARWQANPLRPESFESLSKDLALARDLGAVLVNIHLEHEAGLANYLYAILPLIRNTAEAGLQLAIENTPFSAPEDFNQLFDQLREWDRIPHRHVGMCLDLGHANLCAATRNDYLAFLARLKPSVPIIHLHLHENWGDADSHLPLFTGPAGRDDSGIRRLLDQLQQRQFSGSIILEQWPHPPSLLNHARDRLLNLLRPLPKGPNASKPSPLPSASPFIPPQDHGPQPGISEPTHPKSPLQPEEVPGQTAVPSDPLEAMVQADRRSRSWREKLDSMLRLLSDGSAPPTAEQLINLAIYLRFLSTGELRCTEDGRHFRPAHHARIAQEIQTRLARLTEPPEAWLARKIYPWLPSTDQQFQRAEPLTRIRDIAHRNDIPSELKREIKVSLQNKLHRCAGPEDLATSTKILERITAPGASYSPEFVAQFKIFHTELREFFNAQSLEERLNALLPLADPEQAGLIRDFLELKKTNSLPEQLQAFRSLTQLRKDFLTRVQQPNEPEAHRFLLADIGLDDFAFVLTSQIRNQWDANAGPPSYELLLEILVLLLKNLQLSHIRPEECRVTASELDAWRRTLAPNNREYLLRVKASAERCRRLAEEVSDWIAGLFLGRAEKMGQALGVAEHAIRVFGEAEIRAHLVYQLSDVVSRLLQRIRRHLALPAWDVIVGGKVAGRVTSLDHLGDVPPDQSEELIVLLTRAEGDEEIPRGVSGIVLAHPIPHLSHLAVRGRQARVVLVACEDPTTFQQARAHLEKTVSLEAGPDRFVFVSGINAGAGTRLPSRSATTVPEVQLASAPVCIPLSEVSLQTGGGKAYAAKRLAELARGSDAGFSVPAGVVIPFGVMEFALGQAPDLKLEYERRLRRLAEFLSEKSLEEAAQLREWLSRIPVPEVLTAAVQKTFPPEARLIVRSSANGEDLEELAGAGLYASVANVLPADLSAALRTVWASLWLPSAVISRHQAGISQAKIHMAVLIQEMLVPDYAFVLHTVNPLNEDHRELFVELAVGLGETLVSAGRPGTPYRWICHKESGNVSTLAFTNYSAALRPASTGGVSEQIIDYSRIPLSLDPDLRQSLGRRLASVGALIENAFGRPQDIEGAVVGEKLFVVQSRPQQGLSRLSRNP